MRGVICAAGLALMTVALGSCQLARNQLTYDRAAEKDIQDYRDVLAPRPMPPEDAAAVPELQPVIATPEDLKLPSPLVTVSVNQTVSLRELMFELAEQAGVDIEMDPQIHGSIIFTAKDRPFNDVVDRICAMSGLRYRFKNGVLRVELDRPYIKNYRVDYMNIKRTIETNIKTAVAASSSSQTTGSTLGSDASVANKFDPDLWKELDDGLKQVLTASDTEVTLATLADPVATPVAPPTPAPIVDPNNPNAPPTPAPPSTAPPTLNVSAPPGEPALPNAPATYSISKQTGVVSVFANERQHVLVKKFLDNFRRIATTQILIEAKVLEVSLKDEFSTGIDWGDFHNITGVSLVKFGNTAGPDNLSSNFTASINFGKGFKPIISALSTFGTVRALSSPRVTVINNQPAVVNVAENQLYFSVQTTITTQTTANTTTSQPSFSSTLNSVPEGVLMNVVPTANPETGEVVLAIRPTVTKQSGRRIVDPAIALNFAAYNLGDPPSALQETAAVPQMVVQEVDSIVKIQSGQTIVMGGLMKDSNDATRDGVPVLADVPLLGNAFRKKNDSVIKSELVIFLKATIIPGSNVDNTDRDLYKNFSLDRRPSRL